MNSFDDIPKQTVFSPSFQGCTPSDQSFVINRGPVDWSILNVNVQGSPSTTQPTWVAQIPSVSTLVARKVRMNMKGTATFNFTCPDNIPMLEPGKFALRALPISSTASTIQLQINNGSSYSDNTFQLTPALQRFGTNSNDRTVLDSLSAISPDCYQNYADGVGASNNPLNWYQDGTYNANEPRGAVGITSITQTSPSANNYVVSVGFDINELLSVGVFERSIQEAHGSVVGCSQIQVTLTFIPQLIRMFSMVDESVTLGKVLTGFNIEFTQQQLAFYCSTPPPDFRVSPTNFYQAYKYQPWISSALPVGGGAQPTNYTAYSSNIQITSVPKFFLIWVRPSTNYIQSSLTNAITTADYAFPITNLNITFGNKSGIWGNATNADLYYISALNGINMTYSQFSGSSQKSNGDGTYQVLPTVGSYVCLSTADNFPLVYPLAPGVGGEGSVNFQVQVNYNDNRPAPLVGLLPVIPTEVVVVTVFDNIWTVSVSGVTQTENLLTPKMVQDAKEVSVLPYSEFSQMSGGARMGKLRSFFQRHGDTLATIGKTIGQAVAPRITSTLTNMQPVKHIRSALDARDEQRGSGLSAGSMRGGKVMTKNMALKAALM